MFSTILLLLCSFGLALWLTPIIRQLARNRGWFDQPDHNRKLHTKPIPRIGGVPILLACAGSLGILAIAELFVFPTAVNLALIWKLLPAGIVIFAVGVLDDLVGLRPQQKLAGQIAAAGLACMNGIQFVNLGGFTVSGYLGVPLTIFWLVGCANAFNLIDGVDGLAAGTGLIGSISMLVTGLLSNDTQMVTAIAPLAGALLGFLFFNSNPASIFLGDCGSLFVGLMLASCGVVWSQTATTLPGLAAPLLVLSIPLIDTALSIARRFLRRQPIFHPDRDHIHHRLLDRGLSPRRVTFVLYAASVFAACFALLESRLSSGYGWLVLILAGAFACMGIRQLGYQEFAIASRLLRQNSLRSMVRAQMSLLHCEQSLRAARSVEECWRVIRAVSRESGFSSTALRLARQQFYDRLHPATAQYGTLHILLSDSEYVRFTYPLELSREPVVFAPFADLLKRTLSAKAVAFRADAQLFPRKGVPQPTSPRGRARAFHARQVHQS